jgi:hypothetical protein
MTSAQGLDRPAVRTFSRTLSDHGLSLRRRRTEILQLNVCKLCNLTCIHCHGTQVRSGKEIINRDTLDRILASMLGPAARREGERDLGPLTATYTALTTDSVGAGWIRATGRRYLVEWLREMPRVETIIDRSNLTILLERGYEGLAGFLAAHRVKIVASMPCYEPENVNAQRGDGVFGASIQALQLLNKLG